MKKTISGILAVVAIFAFCGCARFQRPEKIQFSPSATSEINTPYLSGMLLYGVSAAPYGVGDIVFKTKNYAEYRYKVFGKNASLPDIQAGYDASGWTEIENGGTIAGTDCRNIAVVTVDKNNRVIRYAGFEYIPGIIYGQSNSDQYDDEVFYNEKNPSLEDPRAVALASNLFKSAKTSFYGTFGSIVQGFLTVYGKHQGEMAGLYHTGTDFFVCENQPFFSPIDGTIIYSGTQDGYNMLIIYNAEHNISLIILHGDNVAPAQALYSNGKTVAKGDLLGYGGGKGHPAGPMHLHIEVRVGEATRYQNFSSTPDYTRMGNYDPLVLTDMFSLKNVEKSAEYDMAPNSSANAQNGAIAVETANWMYYINSSDSNRIYASRPDGSNSHVIVDTASANLIIGDDGFVYYSNLTEKSICKVSCDGSAKATVIKHDAPDYLFYLNSKLYYINKSDGGKLYRADTNGENAVALNKSASYAPFYYSGKFYYAVGMSNKAERIYSINPDGSENTRLIDLRCDTVTVYNDTLFYRRYPSAKNYFSVPLGKTVTEAAVKNVLRHAPTQLLMYDDFLIFSNENDGNSIYIQPLGKTVAQKLTNDVLCDSLTLCDDYLYYTMRSTNTTVRLNISNGSRSVLETNGLWTTTENFFVIDFVGLTLGITPIPQTPPNSSATPAAATNTPASDPTATPVPPAASAKATEAPSSSPNNSAAPTETPDAASAPTATPDAASAPTATPDAASAPTATPGAASAPTATPQE